MLVFLDIDGVLNMERDWKIPYTLNHDCMDNFAMAMKGTKNIKIILISSWRRGYHKDFDKCTKQIQQLWTELEKRDLSIYDSTKFSPTGSRMDEINYYLRRSDDTEYVIIDDDLQEYPGLSNIKGFYLISAKTGFSKSDIKKWRKFVCRRI